MKYEHVIFPKSNHHITLNQWDNQLIPYRNSLLALDTNHIVKISNFSGGRQFFMSFKGQYNPNSELVIEYSMSHRRFTTNNQESHNFVVALFCLCHSIDKDWLGFSYNGPVEDWNDGYQLACKVLPTANMPTFDLDPEETNKTLDLKPLNLTKVFDQTYEKISAVVK